MLFSATVPTLLSLLEVQHSNPGFGYMLFASAFLAAVALWGGVVRRDALALRLRPVRVKVALAVASGAALAWIAAGIVPIVDLGAWQPAALYRLPLYLIALAYGPSIGFVVGLGYLAVAWLLPVLEPASFVLALELTVLGWLAIHPSPANHRWAGPAYALLAYALAWSTAGLAGVVAAHGSVSTATIVQQHAANLTSLVIIAALLGTLAPERYRRWFPESRTHETEPVDPS